MDDKTPLTTEENAESRRRKLRRKKRPYLPFLLVLAALSITAFIIPLRPDYSESEKRDLATFPRLTLEALRSGQWMRDFENWFTDTFPAREDWVSLGERIDDLHGMSSVTVQGAPIVADEIPVNASHLEELIREAKKRDEELAALKQGAAYAGDADPYRRDDDDDEEDLQDTPAEDSDARS